MPDTTKLEALYVFNPLSGENVNILPLLILLQDHKNSPKELGLQILKDHESIIQHLDDRYTSTQTTKDIVHDIGKLGKALLSMDTA